MLSRIRRLWFGGAAALAIVGAALGALATPAQAQEWFGVQVGPFGFGVGNPYYPSPYYAPPYYAPYYHYYYPYGYRWGYPY